MEEDINFTNQESIFDTLQKMAGTVTQNLNILEEKIDVKLQMEYFEISKKVKENLNIDEIKNKKDQLFNPELSENEKKELLCSLASLEDVEIFRIIEKFASIKDNLLHDWAVLALQESRMLLKSALLNENQVFISTGLGGKENKLRYFIVLICNDNQQIDDLKKRIIHSELNFGLKKQNCEMEKISFNKKYAAILSLIPIDIAITDLLKSIIGECNKIGDFLKPNFLITNVKEFELDEIDSLIEKTKTQENKE